MVEIYLQDSPKGEGYIRICDFGLTLMRLSYTYEISTPTREQIFDSILINNGVGNEEGNLYLDAPLDKLSESILQFCGLRPEGMQHALLESRDHSQHFLR